MQGGVHQGLLPHLLPLAALLTLLRLGRRLLAAAPPPLRQRRLPGGGVLTEQQRRRPELLASVEQCC